MIEEVKKILIRFSKQRETIIARNLDDFLKQEDRWAKEGIEQIHQLYTKPDRPERMKKMTEQDEGLLTYKQFTGKYGNRPKDIIYNMAITFAHQHYEQKIGELFKEIEAWVGEYGIARSIPTEDIVNFIQSLKDKYGGVK